MHDPVAEAAQGSEASVLRIDRALDPHSVTQTFDRCFDAAAFEVTGLVLALVEQLHLCPHQRRIVHLQPGLQQRLSRSLEVQDRVLHIARSRLPVVTGQ
ncbi:hypothetical protein ABZX68_33090 [Streptomyces cellulosae]